MRYSVLYIFTALLCNHIHAQTVANKYIFDTGYQSDSTDAASNTKKYSIQLGYVQQLDAQTTGLKGGEIHVKLYVNKSETDRLYIGIGTLIFPGKDYLLLQPQARTGFLFKFPKMSYDFGLNANYYNVRIKNESVPIQSIDLGFHMYAMMNLNKKKGIYAGFMAPAMIKSAKNDSDIQVIVHGSLGFLF